MARFLAAIDGVNQSPDFFFNNGGSNQFGSFTPPPPSSRPLSISSSPPSSSSSTSIVIVIIIVASAIIVSASIYLLLRYLSRRFHRSFRTFSAVDDVIPSNNDNGFVLRDDGLDSLPLFTFSSVTGNIVAGDCAVCLSKFEPQDQLRLLPLCCHAFHVRCIDTWLTANQTCPLCRSTIYPTEADVLDKILASNGGNGGNSFRIEIGSISRRRTESDAGQSRGSYSVGSFDYIVDGGYELSRTSTHRRGPSETTSADKESVGVPVNPIAPPGDMLAAEVTGGRSWLRDYVERVASISSRSIRSSGRFLSGSSRRSDPVVPIGDLESNRVGEEISELFRWLSGV